MSFSHVDELTGELTGLGVGDGKGAERAPFVEPFELLHGGVVVPKQSKAGMCLYYVLAEKNGTLTKLWTMRDFLDEYELDTENLLVPEAVFNEVESIFTHTPMNEYKSKAYERFSARRRRSEKAKTEAVDSFVDAARRGPVDIVLRTTTRKVSLKSILSEHGHRCTCWRSTTALTFIPTGRAWARSRSGTWTSTSRWIGID